MKPIIITSRSASEGLAEGLDLLTDSPYVVREESRNGGVSVYDGPVIIQNKDPLRRVIFSPIRDANPFFHLFEAFWMLGGRNDLPWLAQFNKRMASYSDDGGKTQPAAYGHRWRNYFGYDQLDAVVEELKSNPATRRAVLGMWDPWGIHQLRDVSGHVVNHFGDLAAVGQGSADVPCNTQCYFTVRDGKLNMGVTCRSNDILWGAHGANIVHFSILLEYLAARCGFMLGELTQFSWNYHLYDNVLKRPVEDVIQDLSVTDYYTARENPMPATAIFTGPEDTELFDRELPLFLEWAAPEPRCSQALAHPFLKGTAMPMLKAWRQFKKADLFGACQTTLTVEAADWRKAANEWMVRRYDALHLERKV